MKHTPLLLAVLVSTAFAAPPEPKFRAENIGRVEIGYGVAVADVDGDKRLDILLADKKQIVWFQNPGLPPAGAQTVAPVAWKRHVMAENLTAKDNVCIAAQDIDGDGRCEVAVGAEWNPADTENSGAVFYLIAPADRTQKWEPLKFPNVEPTTHRMKWLQINENEWGLVVSPLHGRGNKNGEGAGVKTLIYQDPKGGMRAQVLEDTLHATHNFEVNSTKNGADPRIAIGGREGVMFVSRNEGKWTSSLRIKNDGTPEGSLGVGEVRAGQFDSRREFLATVEPMHGNTLAVYRLQGASGSRPDRKVLTDQLNEGHALATGNILGGPGSEIVVGFRGNPGKPRPVGIRLWTALAEDGGEWRESVIDDGNMACEDLTLADLDGDGDLDIVAAGRATKNLMVYWNDTVK